MIGATRKETMSIKEDPRRPYQRFDLETIAAQVSGYTGKPAAPLGSINWHLLEPAVAENEHSLVVSTLLIACADDFGYDASLSRQIRMRAQPGEILVCISSSGNSTSILAALRAATASTLRMIAVAGFDGGEAAGIADIILRVTACNYGLVGGCQQIPTHNIAQYLCGRSTRDV
jgi:D-sedoheptulose 7-phosphate isomerase